ncbi:MAG: autotransporter domain-containing protein, partial [Alphaproteobacteria bacterium]|nr:autotransporter domain-containing protein [Alphaproteobacteria bacterium]
ETGGGQTPIQDGFDLKIAPYYATSLRTFIGADSRIDVDLGDFLLQPEARLGYRFDFLNNPVHIHGAFVGDPTDTFSISGPDPSRGNVVAGATLGASTETWSLGANFDWVRGSNGSSVEVGTFSLLGRI